MQCSSLLLVWAPSRTPQLQVLLFGGSRSGRQTNTPEQEAPSWHGGLEPDTRCLGARPPCIVVTHGRFRASRRTAEPLLRAHRSRAAALANPLGSKQSRPSSASAADHGRRLGPLGSLGVAIPASCSLFFCPFIARRRLQRTAQRPRPRRAAGRGRRPSDEGSRWRCLERGCQLSTGAPTAAAQRHARAPRRRRLQRGSAPLSGATRTMAGGAAGPEDLRLRQGLFFLPASLERCLAAGPRGRRPPCARTRQLSSAALAMGRCRRCRSSRPAARA